MKSLIDYTYYRICKLYYKYDNGRGLYGKIIISLTEIIFFEDIYILLQHFSISSNTRQEYSKWFTSLFVIIAIIIFVLNYLIFNQKFKDFDKRWKDESNQLKALKGLLIVVFLLIPWLLLYFINSVLLT
jgi:uncharacterized membrane protein YidH (DUF202 family)